MKFLRIFNINKLVGSDKSQETKNKNPLELKRSTTKKLSKIYNSIMRK